MRASEEEVKKFEGIGIDDLVGGVAGAGIIINNEKKKKDSVEVKEISDAMIRQMIDDEFPKKSSLTLTAAIETCISQAEEGANKGSDYSAGDWVEICGPDMLWRCACVKRIVKQAPDDWDWNDPSNAGKEPDWNFFYNAGKQRMLEVEQIRSPEEGLRAIFGHRPWLFQQHALLKYERYVRFQKDHPKDFEEVKAQEFARNLFDSWIEDDRNKDLKKVYDEASEGGIVQEELVDHILKPFQLIDEMTEKWDFEGEEYSCFTYLGILGSGILTPLMCLGMQMVIPVLLLKAQIDQNARGNNWACRLTPEIANDEDAKGDFGTLRGKIMIFCVLVYYLFKVTPDTMISFWKTAGTADTVYSRLMSLRKQIFLHGDDNLLQMVGFKVDLYMNTAFECLLYGANLYMIFATNEILDVILNSLAIEFVHQLDEAFVASEWWDPEKRWLKAGSVNLVLQANLRLKILADQNLFCEEYGITLEALREAVDNNESCLLNEKKAREDEENLDLLSPFEAIEKRLGSAALKKKNWTAIKEYVKMPSQFGLLSAIKNKVFQIEKGSVFYNFEGYRTWSSWDKLLFLPPVPDMKSTFDKGKTDQIISTEEKPFRNHDVIAGADPFMSFMMDLLITLGGAAWIKDVLRNIRSQSYKAAVFRFFDGLIEVMALLVQIGFPLFILMGMFVVPACY